MGINSTDPTKTSVGGLPQAGLNAIIAISAAVKTASGSGCVITGGTEPGHATHCVGKAIWDFRDTPGTRAWIMGQDRNPVVNGAGNKKYTVKIGNQVVICTYELRPPKYKQDRLGNLRKGMSHSVHWHCELQQCVDPSTTKPATTRTQS